MNKSINTIRMLSIEMIERANSGHPGICMGAAPMMYSLFAKKMNYYSKESSWINRDRFILAAGHGSAMLYSTLHLAGFNISMQDLKEFRQLHSKTPGHPEYKHTDGIDATSGPLGQGIAQAVGIALAEEHLATKYNKYSEIINHYTYVLCGDGDLQEGVSAEASSLAGHLNLKKLIVLWDSNDIQLDSEVNIASTEDVRMRYQSYGWNTILVENGNDETEILLAIEEAKKSDKPTLIEVKTIIGYGAPNKGNKSDAHGAPLGAKEVSLVKEFYKWTDDEFSVDEEIYKEFNEHSIIKGKEKFELWNDKIQKLKEIDIELYNSLINDFNEQNLDIEPLTYSNDTNQATRVSSGEAIQNINSQINNLIGGSADLSKSNNSTILKEDILSKENYAGKNIAFGVREFAMAAITNGLVLHGGLKAFCSTFFVFSDYLKPAIRMSAIQKIGTIYILTHDSVAVGEDGPTHQPIEQLTGLRAIPNINIFRPCDANETQAAWQLALNSTTRPSILALTRQNVPTVTCSENIIDKVSKGAYVISDLENFEKVIIASGSEVSLAIDVQKKLKEEGINVRVVSMPNFNEFDRQNEEYKKEVLGNFCKGKRYFLEMANSFEGYKYAKTVIGIDTFGESGEGSAVINHFGFNVEKISKIIKGE